jgi:amino acid adenylation domain-containing protein
MAADTTSGGAAPELSAAKRALREALLRGQGRDAGIPRRPPGEDAPLSFAQERLWFLDRLRPGDASYNLSAALRLRAVDDEAALGRALAEIVRRHESLRTVFREVDGSAVQVVRPFRGFALPVQDLSGLAGAGREAEALRLASREAARPFDLAAGPLFRASLLRLGGGEHLLLLCSHHVVSDGWSGQVLLRELWALYDAYRQGRESPLPELPVQYADYAVWQRRQPPEAQARQLAYWKERLAGAPEVLELPTDFPRPPAPTFRGASVPVEVPGALAERLREAARGEGATLHMVVLAAFQALLGRYAGSDDVVVGSPVAGRTRRETEGLIGFFVNTLVLRVDLGGDPTFRELLARVREATLGAYGHQELPFARLVAELRPERAPGHSPLFQVMFALEDSGTAAVGGGSGPRARALETEPGATPFDLSLALHAHARGIGGQLHFSTELFERGTAGRLLEHLVRVLEQAADHPDRPLSRLELPTPAERARLLGEWSGAGASPPDPGALHLRFEARAAADPGAPALACGGESLSYGQLNARANRLARRLHAHGVAAESRVGLCAGRSPDLVVGMLGILKAGGAYVPLDPAYPAERLAWMAADSGVRVLLAPAELRARVPLPEIEAIAPGDPAADAESGDDLGIPVDPDQLAYVIYTSGSSGRPKGVAVPHGAAAGRLASAARALGVREGSRLLSTASPSFDASVLEIFLPLVSGAALHLADRDTVLSPDALERLLRDRAVDVWVSTPVLLGALPPADLPALRVVSAGGERLSAELAARWADGRRMLNLYGPTETTVFATLHEVRAGSAAPPIGRPAPGSRAYVLDAHGKPAPVGVPGELYLGGAGLARGYLGRPTLTAERFVPDAFSGVSGARLYRTGDRVRWLASGELEYLGRVDQQVKIRGFRIEPGEIETTLRGHAGVEDAVVAAYEHAPGDRRLAAWVVPRPEHAAALAAERVETLPDGTEAVSADPSGAAFARLAQDLRRAARERLPDYMVPAVFLPIDRVPLTAGGKVDRAALPAPAHRDPDPRGEEPRDYLEVQLIQLWEELLGAPGIGPTQDFFELGGNSLLALRLFSRINRRLECDLPVSTLFAGATVRQMADAIRDQKGSASGPASPVVPLQPHGPLPPLFLVHSADRGVMGYVNLVRHLGADQPVYGLRDLGEDLGRPLSRIAADHVAALRTVQPRGPYHLCGWSFGGLVAYEMALQLERDGEPVAFVGLMDTMAPSYVVRFPWDDDAQLLAGLAELVALRTGRSFSMDAEALEGLDLDEQIDRLVEQLHAHGAAPPGFSAERVRYERRLMTDRHRSLSGYTEGRFSGTLTLFRASRISRQHDPFFATFTEEERWTYGWHRLSPHPVEVHPVPGSHTLIGSEPHVRVLARCMRESLAAARLRAGSGDPE